jgi:hypothetical protein
VWGEKVEVKSKKAKENCLEFQTFNFILLTIDF